MNPVKVNSVITEYDPISDQKIKYQKIQISESVTVRNISFNSPHYYLVEEGLDIHDPQNFEVPFDNPDVNLRADYQIYREKVGFLQPREIKKVREHLRLSLREVSAILGISYSTLSEIENGLVLHSQIQDTLLRMLEHTYTLSTIVEQHKGLIINSHGLKAYQQIIDKLNAEKNWDS